LGAGHGLRAIETAEGSAADRHAEVAGAAFRVGSAGVTVAEGHRSGGRSRRSASGAARPGSGGTSAGARTASRRGGRRGAGGGRRGTGAGSTGGRRLVAAHPGVAVLPVRAIQITGAVAAAPRRTALRQRHNAEDRTGSEKEPFHG